MPDMHIEHLLRHSVSVCSNKWRNICTYVSTTTTPRTQCLRDDLKMRAFCAPCMCVSHVVVIIRMLCHTLCSSAYSRFVCVVHGKHRVQIIALSFAIKVNWRNQAMRMTTPIRTILWNWETNEDEREKKMDFEISQIFDVTRWMVAGGGWRGAARMTNWFEIGTRIVQMLWQMFRRANFTLNCSTVNSRFEIFNGATALVQLTWKYFYIVTCMWGPLHSLHFNSRCGSDSWLVCKLQRCALMHLKRQIEFSCTRIVALRAMQNYAQ